MSKLEELFSLCMNGQASEEQRQELMDLLSRPDNEKEGSRLFSESWDQLSYSDSEGIPENRLLQIQQAIQAIPEKEKQPVHRVRFLRTGFFRYAAAVVIVLGIGAYLWISNKQNDAVLADSNKQVKTDIEPGRDGAILTLADGSQVILDSLGNGVIATQNGSRLMLKNGLLAYNPSGKASGEVLYNTMTTPKGRQFQLILPDGSKIWLNAASSVKYPTVFTGKERRVEIDGEAYFEIAKNPQMPFKIKAGEATEVEVLGTSFNINSYANEEAVKTTLIEGSVKISAYSQFQTLKPGQQGIVTPSQRLQVIDDADLDKAVAWKNGLFNFDGMELKDVMKQMERWYNIEVVYENEVPDIRFKGDMQRGVPLSAALRFFSKLGIKTNLEGRTLMVSGK